MGIRFIPEHKPSLKKGPRGIAASQTTEHNAENVETFVSSTPEPVVEVTPAIETVAATENEAPAVQENVEETVAKEKPVTEIAKDLRKKKS